MKSGFAFDEWLAGQSERVNRTLLRLLPEDGSVLSDPIRYALETNGKRMRPALFIAAYEAVRGGQADERVLELACAVELIHTYSLIHDDLPSMDNDALRRGRPTLHRAFSTPVALTAGAALIPFAFRVLLRGCSALELDRPLTQRMVRELARSAGASGMVGGQVLDLESEGRAISLEDLEHLHRAKTGALISASVRLGALSAGATDEVLRAMTTYARQMGLAFQITDDVLDETEASAQLGKTAGKDRVVAKATFPALLGVERAAERARDEVAQAVKTLQDAGVVSPQLEAMATFAIARRR